MPRKPRTSAEEFEDYLELRDPKVREHIRASYKEYLEGKFQLAETFLAEFKRSKSRKKSR